MFAIDANNSIKFQSFVWIQLNGLKYSNKTLIILFKINPLFTHT